jgi:transcriptional regulator with XRE-family HTH domain
MSDSTILVAYTNGALLELVGAYVRHHRLAQNKTQQQLADEAGIGRITVVLLEKGRGSNLLSLIQVLRALDALDVLNVFEVKTAISPLMMAELTLKQRKRARPASSKKQKYKSPW